jgi:hypothetical protein
MLSLFLIRIAVIPPIRVPTIVKGSGTDVDIGAGPLTDTLSIADAVTLVKVNESRSLPEPVKVLVYEPETSPVPVKKSKEWALLDL